MKYRTIYPITAANINAAYRLTIDALLNFHESSVARYMTTLNVAAFDVQKEDKTWVISEINVELPAPPVMWSEDVEITLWVSEMSPLRVWIDWEAKEVHTGVVAAHGNSCWSLISMSDRKLVSCEGFIPSSEIVDELTIGPHKKRIALKLSDEPISTIGHTINLIDLDFNGHTNNRRYINLALICFDEGFLRRFRPDSLNIKFLKESRMGDSISNYTYATEDSSTYVGKVMNGSGEELCRVVSHWREKEVLPDIAEVNFVRNPYKIL